MAISEHTESNDQVSKVTIIINGGNNQILPSATHATQVFYNCKPDEVPAGLPDAVLTGQPVRVAVPDDIPPEAKSHLRKYISDEAVLDKYLNILALCTKARDLALIVVDMVGDSAVKVDKDEMVKRRFLEVILPLAPSVSSRISNLRHFVNEAWAKRKSRKQP